MHRIKFTATGSSGMVINMCKHSQQTRLHSWARQYDVTDYTVEHHGSGTCIVFEHGEDATLFWLTWNQAAGHLQPQKIYE